MAFLGERFRGMKATINFMLNGITPEVEKELELRKIIFSFNDAAVLNRNFGFAEFGYFVDEVEADMDFEEFKNFFDKMVKVMALHFKEPFDAYGDYNSLEQVNSLSAEFNGEFLNIMNIPDNEETEFEVFEIDNDNLIRKE